MKLRNNSKIWQFSVRQYLFIACFLEIVDIRQYDGSASFILFEYRNSNPQINTIFFNFFLVCLFFINVVYQYKMFCHHQTHSPALNRHILCMISYLWNTRKALSCLYLLWHYLEITTIILHCYVISDKFSYHTIMKKSFQNNSKDKILYF